MINEEEKIAITSSEINETHELTFLVFADLYIKADEVNLATNILIEIKEN